MIPKFRAWDKENEAIKDVITIYLSENAVELHFQHGENPDYKQLHEVVIMQSTGLKDKNGVEIFEGDIVFSRYANAYTPVFQNGIYMAYNPKNLMQNDPSTQFNIIWRNGCEVVGNIYENQDLVEVAE